MKCRELLVETEIIQAKYLCQKFKQLFFTEMNTLKEKENNC